MITNKYSILQYIFYFYYIVCIATFEINSLITSYSAACVPLHITFAAPVAVERRTVSSKLIPFSSESASAAITLSPAPTVLPTGTLLK